jgi:hypothetical protein
MSQLLNFETNARIVGDIDYYMQVAMKNFDITVLLHTKCPMTICYYAT